VLSAEDTVLRQALGADYGVLEKSIYDFDFEAALQRLGKSADERSIVR
jgi:hypothetical protein